MTLCREVGLRRCGPQPPHINITRAPGADSGLATSARDFTAASHLLTPRPGILRLSSPAQDPSLGPPTPCTLKVFRRSKTPAHCPSGRLVGREGLGGGG